jgi:protein-tyrosine phosphatase
MIDHLDRLDKAVDLIDRTRKEDNKSKIMCQCYHGKHNSVTLLVAYMRV